MRPMIHRRRGLAALGAGLALALAARGTTLAATPISACDTTITESGSYVLTQDLDCSTTGITIMASRVHLDLNGHTLTGLATGKDDCPDADGITVASGVSVVVITNGTVTGFRNGIHIGDSSEIFVLGMNLVENCQDGLNARSPLASHHVYKHNIASRNGSDGFDFCGDWHEVCFNIANDNCCDGISATTSHSRFVCNTTSYNGKSGINQEGDDDLFASNKAFGNGCDGINLLGDRNRVYSNKSSSNKEDGIQLVRGSEDNVIRNNFALLNQGLDLVDGNQPESCPNTWENNFFNTDNDPDDDCIF